jgi:hypothetical protein
VHTVFTSKCRFVTSSQPCTDNVVLQYRLQDRTRTFITLTRLLHIPMVPRMPPPVSRLYLHCYFDQVFCHLHYNIRQGPHIVQARRDVSKREKRILSRGEPKSSRSPPKQMKKSDTSMRDSHWPQRCVHFQQRNPSGVKPNENKYSCSRLDSLCSSMSQPLQ